MSRISETFEALKVQGRKALVTFIMAGDPDPETAQNIFEMLPEAGADIIEIGMPFTDPAADGVTIQKSGLRALKAGMTLKKTLEMVKKFRSKNSSTPIVLMGYVNPVFSYGYEKFAQDAKSAGVDGLIIVDLPPEEDEILRQYADRFEIDMIRLITPTTDEARLSVVLEGAGGFLYYVSITGVTGTKAANPAELKPHLDIIRSKTNLPIAVGFGIKTPKDAQEMSLLGDAVVVGSAIINKIEQLQQDNSDLGIVSAYVKSLSGVLKNGQVY